MECRWTGESKPVFPSLVNKIPRYSNFSDTASVPGAAAADGYIVAKVCNKKKQTLSDDDDA